MTSYGRIKEFRPKEETIEYYLEHIELFFPADEIADACKESFSFLKCHWQQDIRSSPKLSSTGKTV